jgi:hypothetical protein
MSGRVFAGTKLFRVALAIQTDGMDAGMEGEEFLAAMSQDIEHRLVAHNAGIANVDLECFADDRADKRSFQFPRERALPFGANILFFGPARPTTSAGSTATAATEAMQPAPEPGELVHRVPAAAARVVEAAWALAEGGRQGEVTGRRGILALSHAAGSAYLVALRRSSRARGRVRTSLLAA